MKSIILITTLFIFTGIIKSSFAQSTWIEVEGSIVLDDNDLPNPSPGTIRWNGRDFEGWNGVIWASLTGNLAVGYVTDIDRNEYNTIQIGNQEWMAENLKTTTYNDGSSIVYGGDNSVWESNTTGAYTYYNNVALGNDNDYGKLYNWYAVATDKLCPVDWRVPSREDFQELKEYLGDLAGKKMKEQGFQFWSPPNTGTNQSGFSGRPGGTITNLAEFYNLGSAGLFWTRTDRDTQTAYAGHLISSGDSFMETIFNKGYGTSIRCIKN